MTEHTDDDGEIGGTDRQLSAKIETTEGDEGSRSMAVVVVENAHISLLRDGMLKPLVGSRFRPAARVHRLVLAELREVGLELETYTDVSVGVKIDRGGARKFGRARLEVEATDTNADENAGERELGDGDRGRVVGGGSA